MKKRNLLITTIGLASILSILVVSCNFASAVSNNSQAGTGQALEISPPVINLATDPGKTIKTEVKIRNISGGTLVVSGQLNDFVAGNEDGTPKLLLDDNETSPYSIKQWTTPLSEVTLTKGQLKSIPVTIKVPSNAAPGGYYGVIRFSGHAPSLSGTGVSLSASLGSLVMLKVKGAVNEKLSLVEFGVSKDKKTGTIFEETPITFFQRLKNEGNIHEQPSGKITITDMFGKKVAYVSVNDNPHNILPNSIRKFEEVLDKATIGNKVLFGKYTADLDVTYGDKKDTLTKTITFWIIPFKLIGVLIVAIIAIITVLVFFIKRYNQFIINKAQGKPKTPKAKKTKA